MTTTDMKERLDRRLAGDGRTPEECARMIELMLLFAALPPPPDRFGLFPDYRTHHARFLDALEGDDGDDIEERFLVLYCHVHGHEAPYTPAERTRMDETGGYWCHAGGLSPILKAGPHLRDRTVSLDFGAGNGLQGLLLQKLYPHREAIQVEISSRMIDIGKDLQRWLGIDAEKVRWIAGDVLDHTDLDADFVYLYRPVRPQGEGRRFYERLSARLERRSVPVVIFSIADCLGAFLSERFEVFYGDGHLTCYRNTGGARPAG